MKKIVSLSTLLVCCFCLAACNTSKSKKEVASETTTVQETTTVAESTIKDTQVIGSDAYGYVKVPKSWIHFTEVEGGDDIQYCDGTDINIVTLNTFKPEHLGVSESEYAALDAVQVSTSIYQTKQQSKDFSKVWGSKSKIGGYDAYVVNCIAKNGKYLVIYIFKSDDGKFRYVSLEGTPEVLKDMLPLIEQSWTNIFDNTASLQNIFDTLFFLL